MTYLAERPARRQTLRVRGLDFQLYHWAGADPRPVLLVHGWGDSGETFQFLVDRLPPQLTLVAFDARGFGRTEWAQDGYWFPDYLADLDAIVDVLSPDRAVDLVGHSMGGNVALLYAGVRPDRVRNVVSLEGFGMLPTQPGQAPARYRDWLDEIRGGVEFATYDDFAHFAKILARRNPRTSPDCIEFVAHSWGQVRADGRIELRADPRHKRVNPVLYQVEQTEACWRQIAAKVSMVAGDQSEFAKRIDGDASRERLLNVFRAIEFETVMGAGHMLHHERPAEVAALIAGALGV
ncbi:MAG: alpha/beta hydrolase [Steroidobacteraceae bacterium]